MQLIIALAMLLMPSWTVAQNTEELVKKPFAVRSLSGTVLIGDSLEGAKGVLVEECSKDWKVVRRSTYTDRRGLFAFSDHVSRKRNMYYLRISTKGANTLLIRVRIDPKGVPELTLRLSFST